MIPQYLILDIDADLQRLKNIISSPNAPTVDMEALLDRIVDAVRLPCEAEGQLLALRDDFCAVGTTRVDVDHWYGLYQWETPPVIEEDDIFIPDIITSCAVNIGYRLIDRLKELRVYTDGALPYTYKGLINDKSILLCRGKHE